MYYKCCIDNCASKRQDVKFHQFPASETGLQKWLQCINSDRLRRFTIQQLRKVFVCHKHFELRFVTETSRIRFGGYPTLFSEEEIQSGVPSVPHRDSFIENVAFDHRYDRRRRQHVDHTYAKPNTSRDVVLPLLESAGRSLEPPLDVGTQNLLQLCPASGHLEQARIEEIPNLPQLPSTSGSLSEERPIKETPKPSELPTVSGPPALEQTVLREIQNIPQMSFSGSSQKQHRKVPRAPQMAITGHLEQARIEEIPNLPQLPSTSGSLSEERPIEETPKPSELPTVPRAPQMAITGTPTEPGSSGARPKRRRRVLRKVADLPPYCQAIYIEYKKSVKQLNFLRRAKRAIKFSKSETFEKLTEKVNPLAKKMMWMQITQNEKKLQGRRFSIDEKMIALSILKQSPKAYRFLQKIFILPSRNTLNKLVSSLNVQPGINDQIFNATKNQVDNWEENKKYCSIIFDEVSLEPGLDYDKSKDHINGFVHLNNKTNQFADHALAFMVRGAIHKWQQPIAYYFCEGATRNEDLKIILKKVINAVIGTGLLPVAIISDQGQSFQSALKSLVEDTHRDQINAGKPTDDVITINGHNLSVIFDPPHLIKGIRNNFLSKNLKYEGKICKWSDIVDVYKYDCELTMNRTMHKLNDTHVIPDKIHKMKVKNCTQVLSRTVSAALEFADMYPTYPDGKPKSESLKNTSEVVSFLDELFDSTNGASLSKKETRGKRLRRAVTDTSAHHQFWRDAVKKIETMKYVDERRGEVSVPSLKNYIVTLKSFIRLWQFFKTKNIKVMRPRYFNSDPIENFFGQVRAYNFGNNDPTCHTFKSTFKSLLITRFIKFHSEGFNCEEDASAQLINIKKIFEASSTNREAETSTPPHNPTETIVAVADYENIQIEARRERLNIHAQAYTAGWLVRKINKKLNCDNCLADLTTKESSTHSWISQREYNLITQRRLTYPSEDAVRMFGAVIKETNKYLESQPHLNNITKQIKQYILSKYSFDFFNCDNHKNVAFEYFLVISIKFALFNWCNSINKILKGTDISRLGTRLPLMQEKALTKYRKKLRNKKK